MFGGHSVGGGTQRLVREMHNANRIAATNLFSLETK